MSNFFNKQIKRQINKVIKEVEEERKRFELNKTEIYSCIKKGWAISKIADKFKISLSLVEDLKKDIPKEDRY